MRFSWLKNRFQLSWLEKCQDGNRCMYRWCCSNQINQLHFDRAFIGMNGVDDGYYTTPDMEEGAVKRAILENAKTNLCLGGFVKDWTNLFAKVAPLKRAIVITSQGHELLQAIKKKTEV